MCLSVIIRYWIETWNCMNMCIAYYCRFWYHFGTLSAISTETCDLKMGQNWVIQVSIYREIAHVWWNDFVGYYVAIKIIDYKL